ncbi:MAG TPA: NADH-quinone oxidoreductase subunit J [Candidatus Baltobacteraceae bacterium]|jgi:NADH-quinone oxidoreductase subunit J|nr:NADH-quinone oxidoreductase subunit J [Candidatus Baltobacteraceae bacterium]
MIFFWVLAAALIASALWCVSARRPVYSVVALLGHFAALAAMYLTLNAEFLAAMQVIVYAGAIMVLFVFVIALLSSGVAPFSMGPDRLPRIGIPTVLLTLIALGFLAYSLAHVAVVTPATSSSGSALGPVGAANVFGSVADFGRSLFTTHLLPFEVTALILMVAVIGVILLAGDQSASAPSGKHAAEVRREMREAILRGGD